MMEAPENCGTIPNRISLARSPNDWREDDVCSFLIAIGLSDLAVVFQKHEVTGPVLLSLTEDDLQKQLGITKFGPRRRLGLAIADLQRHSSLSQGGSRNAGSSIVSTPRQAMHAHAPLQARLPQCPQSYKASFTPQNSNLAVVCQSPPLMTVLAPAAELSNHRIGASFVLPVAQTSSTHALNPFSPSPSVTAAEASLTTSVAAPEVSYNSTTAANTSCTALRRSRSPDSTMVMLPAQQFPASVSRPRSLGPIFPRRALSPNCGADSSSGWTTPRRVCVATPHCDRSGTASQNSTGSRTVWSAMLRPTSPRNPRAASTSLEPEPALQCLSSLSCGAVQAQGQVRVPERQVSAPVNILRAPLPATSRNAQMSGKASTATLVGASTVASRVVLTPPRHRVTLNGAPVSSNGATDVAVHGRMLQARPQQSIHAAESESLLKRSCAPIVVSASQGGVTQLEPQAGSGCFAGRWEALTASVKSVATSAATNEAGAPASAAERDVVAPEAALVMSVCSQTLQPQQQQRQQTHQRQPQQHSQLQLRQRSRQQIGQRASSSRGGLEAEEEVPVSQTENVSLGAPAAAMEQALTSNVGSAAEEGDLASTLREVFDSCRPCGLSGCVDSADLVAACRQQLCAATSSSAVEWTLQDLDAAGSREISWGDFWGTIVTLRSGPWSALPPTGADSAPMAATAPSALASSTVSVAGRAGTLAIQDLGGWNFGPWTEQQAARHKIARHWIVSRALATGVAGQQQIQVRDGAQLRALAREVDTDILAVAARELNLPGSEGVDNVVALLDNPNSATNAARLPLVKPYAEQLLHDALAELASRASGEGVPRVRDPVQADSAVRAYVRQLSEALLLRLRGIASEGRTETSPLAALA